MTSGARRIAFVLLTVSVIVGWGGFVWLRKEPGRASAGRSQGTYYCPMHPAFRSDKPGDCPICSMRLVPLTQAASPQPGAGQGGGMSDMESPPTVQISPERQQQIGIKFAAAAIVPGQVTVRAVGKVAPDERRITHVHTKVNGWIDEVFVDFVGQSVRRGQPLFTLYSPDLVASQEEYLLALKAQRELGRSSLPGLAEGSSSMAAAARRRLELWDLTREQIDDLERTGQVSKTVVVHSPVSGVVTERAAYHHGRTVTPDLDLYTIVDLSHVWVLADVYENEIQNVAVGQKAKVLLPFAGAGKSLGGKVTFVAPTVDPKTRTVQVRTEFENPSGRLRPEAFVDVVLVRDLGLCLVVPRDAVMDTGKSQYVFVDRGDGYLEPRPVSAGQEVEQGRVIASGLKEGERVVTAANFIIDSESRLKGVFENMGRPAEGVR